MARRIIPYGWREVVSDVLLATALLCGLAIGVLKVVQAVEEREDARQAESFDRLQKPGRCGG